MAGTRQVVGGLLLILGLVGCGKREPIIRLEDTEGRQLLAKCTKSGCEFRQQSGPEWPGDRPQLLLHRTGSLMVVCNAEPDASRIDGAMFCRALLCADDRGCPPEPGASSGHCVNGLCIEPSSDLTPDDSVVLCLSGQGLGTDSPGQIEALAMGLNCGTPCEVPKTCRQP